MVSINYHEVLKNAAKSMVRVKKPDHLIKMMTRFLDREMGVSQVSMIVLDVEKGHYVFCDSKGENKLPVNLFRIDKDNPLITWFSRKEEKYAFLKKDYLLKSQLLCILDENIGMIAEERVRERLQSILGCMDLLKASLSVPGYYKGELMGIFLLGDKQDKTGFTEQEILFFQTLASDASMSIKNAEFRRSLLQKIDELEQSLEEIKRLRKRDKEKYLQTILTLAQMVDARDPYTYGHSEDIKELGLLTAGALGIDMQGEKGQILSTSLLLHDVGKLGVSDKILHKESRLDNEEWRQMKEHVRIGARILENHDDFTEVSIIVLHHHENFDGTGYPYRIKGEQIPIQSRIIAVVDAYHAMVSDRPYRKGMGHHAAVQELKRCSGSQFDPAVVDAFLQVIVDSAVIQKCG